MTRTYDEMRRSEVAGKRWLVAAYLSSLTTGAVMFWNIAGGELVWWRVALVLLSGIPTGVSLAMVELANDDRCRYARLLGKEEARHDD